MLLHTRVAESNCSMTHQERLAPKRFRAIILGYLITVFTDHSAITKLFKGRNITSRLARWCLTIQEFNQTFKHLPGRASVVADSLSGNVPFGVVTHHHIVTENLSLHELDVGQRNHGV